MVSAAQRILVVSAAAGAASATTRRRRASARRGRAADRGGRRSTREQPSPAGRAAWSVGEQDMGYIHGRGYNTGMNGGREPEWEVPQQLAAPRGDLSSDPDENEKLLSAEQVASFAERRFIALDNIFPTELLAAHKSIHAKHFPEPSPELEELPTNSIQFPFADDEMAANLITLHPRVLSIVSQLLGTDEIRLTRSNLSQKYGVDVHQPNARTSKGDQGMHKVSCRSRRVESVSPTLS